MHRRIPLLVALFSCTFALAAQRGVRQLTSSGETHTEARLSANGRWVAFRTSANGQQALGLISTDPNSKETVLYNGAPFTRFLWHPNSTGLYFQTGNSINFVRTVGGPPVSIGVIPGFNPTLHAIHPSGQYVLGTRTDSAFADYTIWRLDTDAQSQATSVFTLKGRFLSDLTVDPSGKKIGYIAQTAGSPFAPHDIRRVDIDGQNDISMSGGVIPDILRLLTLSRPRDLAWADEGRTLNFAAADSLAAPWQLYQVSETQNDPILLTTTDGLHLGCAMPAFQRWMVYRGTVPRLTTPPTTHHTVLGLIPPMGGAMIPLEPEIDWVMTDTPSIDASSLHVVFSGYVAGTQPIPRPEVRMISLDREVRVYPRARLAELLNFELPLNRGESGTLYLSVDRLELDPDPKTQIRIPGFDYRIALNPVVLLPVMSGVGARVNDVLKATIRVPNDVGLIGFQVYLQGLRINGPSDGDFTRYAVLPFFE